MSWEFLVEEGDRLGQGGEFMSVVAVVVDQLFFVEGSPRYRDGDGNGIYTFNRNRYISIIDIYIAL